MLLRSTIGGSKLCCSEAAPAPAQAAARHAALQAVEAALGREAELFTEWSGLIAWQPGSSIGWHADNNR